MSVQFSELHTVDGCLEWSPNGKLLATTEKNRLLIRNGDSLSIVAAHTCVDVVDRIEWGDDSSAVLCVSRKRALVEAFRCDDPKWHATIDEGSAAVCNAWFAPRSAHIVTVCRFGLRLTVWDLCSQRGHYIKYPKLTSTQCLAFSSDGSLLAVIERGGRLLGAAHDAVALYSTASWKCLKRFACNSAVSQKRGGIDVSDVCALRFSPNGRYIAVVNSPLEYALSVIDLSGRQLFSLKAYSDALGVKCVKWAASGELLAIGSFDQSVRLVNTTLWRVVATLDMNQKLIAQSDIYDRSIIYEESTKRTRDRDSGKLVLTTRYEIKPLPYAIGSQKVASGRASGGRQSATRYCAKPPIGIGKMDWSSDSRFLAVVNDSLDKCVWLWDLKYLTLRSLLKHCNKVTSVSWNAQMQLAVSCCNDRVYLWTPKGAMVIRVVASRFNAKRICWRPKAPEICLIDTKAFCCCYDLDFI